MSKIKQSEEEYEFQKEGFLEYKYFWRFWSKRYYHLKDQNLEVYSNKEKSQRVSVIDIDRSKVEKVNLSSSKKSIQYFAIKVSLKHSKKNVHLSY